MFLISSCLMGFPSRYDGAASEKTLDMDDSAMAVPVCPETLGGLGVPRVPSEIRRGRVVNERGVDVTRAFYRGAHLSLLIGLQFGCREAVLKARSPSCGLGSIYDGTFTRTVTKGDGVFAKLLRENGFFVKTEED